MRSRVARPPRQVKSLSLTSLSPAIGLPLKFLLVLRHEIQQRIAARGSIQPSCDGVAAIVRDDCRGSGLCSAAPNWFPTSRKCRCVHALSSGWPSERKGRRSGSGLREAPLRLLVRDVCSEISCSNARRVHVDGRGGERLCACLRGPRCGYDVHSGGFGKRGAELVRLAEAIRSKNSAGR